MTRETWINVSLFAYLFLFVGLAGGIFIWRVKRRGGRAPVAFRLLRGPGETIRRKIAKADEMALWKVLGAAVAPILIAYPLLLLVVKFRPATWTTFSIGMGITVIVFVVTLIAAIRWTLGDFKRYRDDSLGYLGEREVAEHLEPLLARGYRVFHDIPAEGSKSDFNIDHVAVGPSGVAIIETKTRRKGRPRPGMKDHVVTYDGTRLIWPWGEDRHGLDQAVNEADWMRKFLKQRTGLNIAVKPILALPGWWVEAPRNAPLAVINSKNVVGAVEGNGSRILTDVQIDLIARQLDARCRDVED